MGRKRSGKHIKGKHIEHEKIDSVEADLEGYVLNNCRRATVSHKLFAKTKLHIIGVTKLHDFLKLKKIEAGEGVKRLLHEGRLIEVSENTFVLSSEVAKKRNLSA